jgi:hypothetical protein
MSEYWYFYARASKDSCEVAILKIERATGRIVSARPSGITMPELWWTKETKAGLN